MDVHLYIYDLSKGLARLYSAPLTGTQIDAIYHTSVVLGGVEYYFGQGIQTATPGSTHHGRPMQIMHLGKTELPATVVEEYIDSLAVVYTPESYDLFLHNCNNFTQDLAMFLVGKGIPEYIRNLPETFLSTPFGQMMKPQIDTALRGITQGPALPAQTPASAMGAAVRPPVEPPAPHGKVRIVTSLVGLERELASASESCAAIFFTSSACPPCRAVSPIYDELAKEVGSKASLIKVDISSAYDVSMKFGVRATPTFMTYLRGEKLDEWKGADPTRLQGNIRVLMQIAHPPHPHRNLQLPSFQQNISRYVLYQKIPPLEKLVQKLGVYGKDPRIVALVDFIRSTAGPDTVAGSVPLPDLRAAAVAIQSIYPSLEESSKFALVDLVRVLFQSPRVSGFFAEEPRQETLVTLLSVGNVSSCPYSLRIVLLQLSCNLFSSPPYPSHVIGSPVLSGKLTSLAIASLVDTDHPPLRVAAASFVYNLAVYNHNHRLEGDIDPVPEEMQVEIMAALVEGIKREEENEARRVMFSAAGLILYEAPMDGEVVELCRVLGGADIVHGLPGSEEIERLLEKGL